MAASIYQVPRFECLELDLTPEFSFFRQEKLYPLQAGASVGGIIDKHNNGNWHPYFHEVVLDTTADFLRFTRKPLLLYFYEKGWGAVAREHLSQLNAVRGELDRYPVNVLVVTSGAAEEFQSLCRKECWSLDAYEDQGKELAGLFRVYSESSPSWGRYAGIEDNLPLPALYLMDNNRKVVVAFPNELIQSNLPVDVVIHTLPYTEKYRTENISA